MQLAQRMTGYQERYLAWNLDFQSSIFQGNNRNTTVLKNTMFLLQEVEIKLDYEFEIDFQACTVLTTCNIRFRSKTS